MSELGRSMSGWVKVGTLALGVGVGMGGVPVPGGGVSKAWAGKIKKDTEYTHNTTVNVALQNRCFNFENTSIFLPKTLLFVLFAVALTYSVRKKSKTNNNG